MSENLEADLQLTEEQLNTVIGGTKGAGCANCNCPGCIGDMAKEQFHKGQAHAFEVLAQAAADGERWHVADSYLDERNNALAEAQKSRESMQKRHSGTFSVHGK